MFKVYNDPMVKESKIIILLRLVWVYAEEKEGFRKGRRENGFESKRERKDVL